MSSFDWSSFFEKLLPFIVQAAPAVIQDVEQLHGNEKSGATKTQLATTALVDAATEASIVDPNDQDKIDAATAITGAVIQSLQAPPPAPSSDIGKK